MMLSSHLLGFTNMNEAFHAAKVEAIIDIPTFGRSRFTPVLTAIEKAIIDQGIIPISVVDVN